MAFRIGLFFVFIGLLLSLLFYATYQSNTSSQNLLGYALIAFTIGIFLIIRYRKPPRDVERFRGYRNYQRRQEERKNAKEEKKKAKKK